MFLDASWSWKSQCLDRFYEIRKISMLSLVCCIHVAEDFKQGESEVLDTLYSFKDMSWKTAGWMLAWSSQYYIDLLVHISVVKQPAQLLLFLPPGAL